ncbi:hypothetical protein ACO0LL_02260 [Undibacterium sp. TC4M20W]|uniref:hypothetical protein n=1 Tax=Undibacterium sp. TC4M20W TaxID=3413052 RepID=UPI003BF123D3
MPPTMKLAAMRADVAGDFAITVAGVTLAKVIFFGRRIAGAVAVGAYLHHIGTPTATVAADPH